MDSDRIFRISIPCEQIHPLTTLLTRDGWTVLDTGERITTDDGHDGEAVLLLEPESEPEVKFPVWITA